MINRFLKSASVKFTSIVFTGNIITQIITFFGFVLYARIFTAADLGIYAVFISLSILMAVVATGRLEMATMLPKENKESFQLLFIALSLSLSFSALIFFLGFLPIEKVFPKYEEITQYWVFLPLGIFLMSSFQSFIIFYNRLEKYHLVAFVKITQVLFFLIGVVILSNIFEPQAILIIGAWLISQFIATIIFGLKSLHFFHAVSFETFKKLIVKYKRYPTVSLTSNFLNTFSNELPNYFLPLFWGVSVEGLYSYAARVVAIPRNLISASVGDVFYSQSNKFKISNPNKLLPYLIKVVFILWAFSMLIYSLAFLLSDELFPLFFGDKFIPAVPYFKILTIASFFLFVQTPISSIVDVLNKLKHALAFNIAMLIVKFSVFIYGVFNISDPLKVLLIYSISIASLSFMYTCYLLFLTKKFSKETLKP